MILAVFSDIHGNVYSLEKALKLMEGFHPDGYLFLGDMAGYYYHQNESIKLLNELNNLTALKGNHDQYFLGALNNTEELEALGKKYGKSYLLLSQNITDKTMEFFNTLQLYEKNTDFEAYHGTPDNYLDEYLYPDTQREFAVEAPIVFTGHTHYPMERKIQDTLFVNPGSIGQPRDFNKGSFSIVDLKNIKVENVRYDYDRSKLEKMILELGDNDYLLKVLKRTKNETN